MQLQKQIKLRERGKLTPIPPLTTDAQAEAVLQNLQKGRRTWEIYSLPNNYFRAYLINTLKALGYTASYLTLQRQVFQWVPSLSSFVCKRAWLSLTNETLPKRTRLDFNFNEPVDRQRIP